MHLPGTYGIVKIMKALKSPLAARLLADPEAREQLRDFLTGKRSTPQAESASADDGFEIRAASGEVVRVTVVPKARAA